MAIQAIRISELPESQSWQGLYTIGVQGGRSVKINLSELSDNAEVLAAAREVLEQIQAYSPVVRPTSMSLPDEYYVPVGGSAAIPAVLSPSDAFKNFIYDVRSGSAIVTPDGLVSVSELGTTVVWVIPVENVVIWKEMLIKGYAQVMMITDNSAIRITSNMCIRLN